MARLRFLAGYDDPSFVIEGLLSLLMEMIELKIIVCIITGYDSCN